MCVVCVWLCVFVCVLLCVCVREAAGGEGARDTESKTRTPHKDVGKKTTNHFVDVFVVF